jgi:hypothetical protein
VFEALQARSPKDFGYMAVELGDGSFVHLVTDLGDAAFELGGLPEVQAFRRGIASRCDEPPQASDAQIAGLYGRFAA